MAEYLVTFIVSMIVEAEDDEHAVAKAQRPFQYDVIPSVARYIPTGSRLRKLGDKPGECIEADVRFHNATKS